MARNSHLRYFGRKIEDCPTRIGNVKLARLDYGEESGCSHCFPHGLETDNSKWTKPQRSWKQYRKTRWKDEGKDVPA